MPGLTTGTHTLELTYDTGTAFGVLTAKREVTLEDPIFTKLAKAYSGAMKKGDEAAAAKASADILSKRGLRTIESGQKVPVSQLNSGPEAPHDFSADVRWYPGRDSLKAVFDVVDSHYAAMPDGDSKLYSAFVDIYICPSGVDEDISRIHVLGNREDTGKPSIGMSPNRQFESEVKAKWTPTAKGYCVEIAIPWKSIKGYDPDWKLLPVEASICSKWRDWSYFIMNKPGQPDTSARSYAALVRNQPKATAGRP